MNNFRLFKDKSCFSKDVNTSISIVVFYVNYYLYAYLWLNRQQEQTEGIMKIIIS